MQLNSRRLTDEEYFAAFLKIDEIRHSNPNAQGSSDEVIGHQLNKSACQVCKMREIAKKADTSLLQKMPHEYHKDLELLNSNSGSNSI